MCVFAYGSISQHVLGNMQADAFEGFQPATGEREALLEAQLSALREQLGSQDSQLAGLKEQAGQCSCLLGVSSHVVVYNASLCWLSELGSDKSSRYPVSAGPL